MSDPAIKLFGKMIQLESNDDVSHEAECDHNNNNNCISCSNGYSSLIEKNSSDSKPENGSSSAVVDQQSPCEGKESVTPKSTKKEEQSETSKSQEKALKKPDKILPCPRCNSTDTKFCYFNNYNVNQPRYFCKNCQRYWTAGGTMRNVPVGAGRRKNKHSSSNPRFIVIPDTFPAHPDAPNPIIYHTLRPNFIPETPLCESMTSTLTIAENSSHNVRVPCLPGAPFALPVPFYAPPPYWNGVVPWMMQPTLSPNSLLGKHPREGFGSLNKERDDNGTGTKVLTPKTLRIDDPSNAAKSSIWTTLGIKHENTSSRNSGVFFKGLESKGGQMSSAVEASSVLQANPAAMSRSLMYRESAE